MIIDGIDNYLFDSYEKCCEKHVCDGDETASPSNSPTKTPTPAVSTISHQFLYVGIVAIPFH